MNEHIKKLCIEAGAAVLPGSSGVFIESLNPEKFATLIVNECLQCIQEFKVGAPPAIAGCLDMAQTIIKTKMLGNAEEQRD